MNNRTLGQTGIALPPVGLGCMEMGGRMKDGEGYLREDANKDDRQYFYLGRLDDDQSIKAIECALDARVSLFDTAPADGAGHGERILGRALSRRRQNIILATKLVGGFGLYASRAKYSA